jgi:Transposase DDE domain
MSGWWTPPRWSAAGRGRRRCGRTWPAGPSTGTAPLIPGTSRGLRLHLLCTLHGLPAGFALTGAKAGERQVLPDILADQALTAGRSGQVIIGDKNYHGRDFEAILASTGLSLLRPARKGEAQRPGTEFFRPLRQIIESINDTLKGSLDPERHGGHTPAGVLVRVLQRLLALTATIWHNDRASQRVKRSLLAYDH